MKYDLGDTVGMAYRLEALALLASALRRRERTVRLLGAADSLWERAGRRLGGNATLEELSNLQIATRLVLSKRTVDAHVGHILAKLGFCLPCSDSNLAGEQGVRPGWRAGTGGSGVSRGGGSGGSGVPGASWSWSGQDAAGS